MYVRMVYDSIDCILPYLRNAIDRSIDRLILLWLPNFHLCVHHPTTVTKAATHASGHQTFNNNDDVVKRAAPEAGPRTPDTASGGSSTSGFTSSDMTGMPE